MLASGLLINTVCGALMVNILVPENIRNYLVGVPDILLFILPFGSFAFFALLLEERRHVSGIIRNRARLERIQRLPEDARQQQSAKELEQRFERYLADSIKNRSSWHKQFSFLITKSLTTKFILFTAAALSYGWHRLWLVSVVLCLLIFFVQYYHLVQVGAAIVYSRWSPLRNFLSDE